VKPTLLSCSKNNGKPVDDVHESCNAKTTYCINESGQTADADNHRHAARIKGSRANKVYSKNEFRLQSGKMVEVDGER